MDCFSGGFEAGLTGVLIGFCVWISSGLMDVQKFIDSVCWGLIGGEWKMVQIHLHL